MLWLYVSGNAVWGLAYMTVTRSQSSGHDTFLIETAKWIAGILALSLPTVILKLRDADKTHDRFSFDQFITSVTIGVLVAVFLGFCLEILLSLFGIRHFPGIPIQKWR